MLKILPRTKVQGFLSSILTSEFSFEGQVAAFKRSQNLLLPKGRIYADIPIDVVNKFEGVKPGPYKLDEMPDLKEIGLKYIKDHPYQTYTGRNRKILEIGCE